MLPLSTLIRPYVRRSCLLADVKIHRLSRFPPWKLKNPTESLQQSPDKKRIHENTDLLATEVGTLAAPLALCSSRSTQTLNKSSNAVVASLCRNLCLDL
jgi:hypothetical protein